MFLFLLYFLPFSLLCELIVSRRMRRSKTKSTNKNTWLCSSPCSALNESRRQCLSEIPIMLHSWNSKYYPPTTIIMWIKTILYFHLSSTPFYVNEFPKLYNASSYQIKYETPIQLNFPFLGRQKCWIHMSFILS